MNAHFIITDSITALLYVSFDLDAYFSHNLTHDENMVNNFDIYVTTLSALFLDDVKYLNLEVNIQGIDIMCK